MRTVPFPPARKALALLALALPAAGFAETSTRTVRVELASPAAFAVENLAGRMTVVPGSGSSVVAIATVHAESAELAAAVRFEEVKGRGGLPTLRVRYPLDRVSTIRYGSQGADGGFLSGFFSGTTRTDYDGERVKVSGRDGTLLYADVEVQLPRRALEGTFRNHIGAISARGVEGTLGFESGSGNIEIADHKGNARAETGSGDVKVTDLAGNLSCETGSGTCVVSGVRGESISCSTGSGDIELGRIQATHVSAETGSGDIEALGLDATDFSAETGSGDVQLEARGSRLARVSAETGSGDVTLKLGAGASFEATAEQGSGEISNGFADAQPIVRRKEVVGYRRGEGAMRIQVSTGSGDLTLEP